MKKEIKFKKRKLIIEIEKTTLREAIISTLFWLAIFGFIVYKIMK